MNAYGSPKARRRARVDRVRVGAPTLPWLVVTLVAVTVGGCSAVTGSPGSPTSASPTTTPTPSPSPTLPASARKPTRSSAVAFTRHWFAAYNHATWALISGELTPISDPDCQFCSRAKQAIEGFKGRNQRVDGGRITISDAKVTGGTPARGMRVDVVYDQSASTILDAAGAVVSTGPAATGAKMLVGVKWTGSRWTVLDVALVT